MGNFRASSSDDTESSDEYKCSIGKMLVASRQLITFARCQYLRYIELKNSIK